MKMKQKYTLALATVLPLAAALSLSTSAQNNNTTLPKQQRLHVLRTPEVGIDSTPETLSGINLYHIGKGFYQLDFSQILTEDAVLSIKNAAKKVVYQKPLSMKENTTTWRHKVGKLKPDTYVVEVATSDTTYWTKFKIGR